MPRPERFQPESDRQHDPGDTNDLEVISRDIVDKAIEELRDANLSKPTRVLAQTVLRGLKRRGDYDDVIADVDRLAGEIGQISTILKRCATALRTEEEEVALRSPGTDVWWNTRTHAVMRALSHGQRDLGLSLWTAVWVDGLAMQDWTRCRTLLALKGLPQDLERIRGQMLRVTDALASETYAAALDPLDGLLDPEEPDGQRLDQGAAVRLGVLRARILSHELSDREMIGHAAEEAVARAGASVWRSVALAALAETQLAAKDVEAARETLEQATQVDQPPTDALVASGLLHEQGGLWALADQYYDLAVERDRAAIHPVLLRPVPPRLLVRAAMSSALEVQQSLDLLDQALAQGIGGDNDYPERDVYLARAEKLEELAKDEDAHGLATDAMEHRAEAAESLVEAGYRYLWSGLTTQAVELFEGACGLAPDVAEFRWTYAEALRLDASHVDSTVDLRMLETARTQVEHGLRLRLPDDTESWVLITQAMIEEELPSARHDPALLVERALLKDPSYTLGYGFLAGILRRQGFVQEAFEVSSDGRETAEVSDPLLFDAHLSLLLDRGQYDDALSLVEYQSLRHPDDDNLVWYRASVLLHMQHPEDALATLSVQELTDSMRVLRGHGLFAAGDVEGSRDEFWSLWNDTRSGPAGHIAGWAAFRAGLLDEAITIYQELRGLAPARTPYTRDLGQMLLVQGQVAEGASLLEEGIAACPHVSELRHLATAEFDFVRHATADERHGPEVADVLADLSNRIDRRCDELLHAHRDVGAVPALLSTARLAMHAGRSLDALAIYEKLIGREEVPEAVVAAIRTGRSACDAANVAFAEDDHDEARSQWSAVEAAIVRISADADSNLLLSLVCRRMLADLVDGSRDEIAAWLDEVSVDADLEDAMTEAAQTLAYDAAHLWSLRDGLLALRDRPAVGPDERRLVATVADWLPLEKVYHLDAIEADPLGSTFLLVSPLELRFGPAVDDLRHSGELTLATSELQTRIEAEMGVRIPWVYPVPAPRLADRQVDVRVYGRWAGSTLLAGPRETWVRQLMEEVEERVRGHLFRLLGVDNVALWLVGWDPSDGESPAWDPTDSRADRLRLARVLRMLLRERVSVADRATIVGALSSQMDTDKRVDSATLNTLRDVRRRLGSSALGVGADTIVVPLPSELEERVAAGLPDDRPVWELPRDQAHAVVADLRAWLRAQPVTPGAISVADGRVRPFVWRLLAAESPAVRILSEAELS